LSVRQGFAWVSRRLMNVDELGCLPFETNAAHLVPSDD
jgi:hypothetical protein